VWDAPAPLLGQYRDDKLGHASVELRDLELRGRGLHELTVRLIEQVR